MIEKNTLHFMDRMELMSQLLDKSIDLAILDPEYGINVGKMAFTKEGDRICKQKNGSILTVKKTPSISQIWDSKPPPQEYFVEVFRVSNHQIIFGIDFFAIPNIGYGRIKWNKGFAEGVSFKPYERAYCSLIDNEVDINLLWAGMQQAKSLSEPMVQQGNKKLNEKRIHSAHKPTLLYKRLLIDYAKKGWVIGDFGFGSASLQISCMELGFDFIACENNITYYNAATKRIAEYKIKLAQRIPELIAPDYRQMDLMEKK